MVGYSKILAINHGESAFALQKMLGSDTCGKKSVLLSLFSPL